MQHWLEIRHRRPGNDLGRSIKELGTVETSIAEAIAGDAADYEVVCAIDVLGLRILYIQATRDMTLKWNDAGGSNGLLTLKENEPVSWYADHPVILMMPLKGYALPHVDVTSFFVTNDDPRDRTGILYVEALYDEL